MDKIEYSRMLIKRTDQTGELPTIPPSGATSLNQFIPTDLFIGEFFLNTVDDLMWIRTDNGILPISISGSSGSTEIQNLSQVLFQGNHTDGFDIVVNNGDTIQYEGLSTGTPVNYLAIDSSGNTISAPLPSGGTISGDYLPLSGGTVTGATKFTSTFSLTGLVTGGSQTFLTVDSDTGQVLTKTNPTFTGAYLPLSGGTVSGGTSFTRGLTASSLNITTLGTGTSVTNLGIDVSGNVVTGSTMSTPTYIQAYNLSSQSFPTAATTTIAGWTNIIAQNASEWNPTTGIFTATKAGTYLVSVKLLFNTFATSIGNELNVSILSTSQGTVATSYIFCETTSSTLKMIPMVTAIVTVQPGQQILTNCYQSTGSSRTLYNNVNGNSITIQELPRQIVR